MPPNPEEPDYYSEPTMAARYGGYDRAPEPPEPPTPWYRRPLALVAFGAIGVIALGLVAIGTQTVTIPPRRGFEPRP